MPRSNEAKQSPLFFDSKRETQVKEVEEKKSRHDQVVRDRAITESRSYFVRHLNEMREMRLLLERNLRVADEERHERKRDSVWNFGVLNNMIIGVGGILVSLIIAATGHQEAGIFFMYLISAIMAIYVILLIGIRFCGRRRSERGISREETRKLLTSLRVYGFSNHISIRDRNDILYVLRELDLMGEGIQNKLYIISGYDITFFSSNEVPFPSGVPFPSDIANISFGYAVPDMEIDEFKYHTPYR